MTTIASAVKRVEERILEACRRAGRSPGEVSLMGVSKFHALASVEEAFQGGIRLFGESRVREGTEKFAAFRETHPGTEVHFIGRLQRNKAAPAAAFFDCLTVDRDPLLDELGRLTAERENPLMILLEYHTGEESKAGYPDLDSLFRAAEKALLWKGLRLGGLMTMAPFTGDEALIRASFRALAGAKKQLEARFPPAGSHDWNCLSMGMTGDFETAIEEGSTLVRIGTAIFVERL